MLQTPAPKGLITTYLRQYEAVMPIDAGTTPPTVTEPWVLHGAEEFFLPDETTPPPPTRPTRAPPGDPNNAIPILTVRGRWAGLGHDAFFIPDDKGPPANETNNTQVLLPANQQPHNEPGKRRSLDPRQPSRTTATATPQTTM